MKSVNISSDEWRWVAVFSALLVTLTLLPYAWALFASDDAYQFMGILYNPKDGATYLSKIQQGVDGEWQFELRHTPQPHDSAGFHLFYLLLGQLARVLGLSSVLIFHLARVAASFFMFFALYQLGATIWQRQRPRRWFFMLIAAGSGLGWLGLILSGGKALAIDLLVPEAFPLLAAYTNPHFPLAIGCVALMTSQYMLAFRPGITEAPSLENGGLLLVVLSVVLAIISPPATIVMGGVLVAYTLVQAYLHRHLPLHEARWSAMFILPAFPLGMYYYAVFRFNDTFGQFNEQNVTKSPNLLLFALGYGLLLLVAIPGLVRAVRRFEPDGDQFMLVWFILNLVAAYLPIIDLQRRLFITLIFPIVYFAIRSLEDYWFDRIQEKWRAPALIALAVFILPTHALTFGAPLAFAVVDREAGAGTGLLLNTDYKDAFNWLNEHSRRDDVVLTAPIIGLWVPAETQLRPVYGHEFETVPAQERLDQVRDFYRGFDCDTLLGSDLPFRVRFVVWGPRENDMGLVDTDDDDIDEVLSRIELETGETLEEGERLPDADLCRIELEENAESQETFGEVIVYVLGND